MRPSTRSFSARAGSAFTTTTPREPSTTSGSPEVTRWLRSCNPTTAGMPRALATIDTVYVAKRRISPVYLLDAVAEIALVAGWARLWSLSSRGSRLEQALGDDNPPR